MTGMHAVSMWVLCVDEPLPSGVSCHREHSNFLIRFYTAYRRREYVCIYV